MEKWKCTLVVLGMFCFGSVLGQFGKERVIEECSLICDPGTPIFADFDGDKDIDLTFSNYSSEVVWYEKLTSGGYRKRIVVSRNYYNQFVYILDVNKDSHQDIVTVGRDGKIFWYLNNGKGNFTQRLAVNTRSPLDTADYTSIDGIQIGDYDADNDLDILVLLTADNSLVWYINQNNQKFVEGEKIIDQNNISSFYLFDIDEDNDLDILFFDDRFRTLGYYKRSGQKYVSNELLNGPLNIQLRSIFFKDIDGDNKIDIVFTGVYGYTYEPPDRIGYIKNLGKGIFSSPVILLESDGIDQVVIEDLNQDGMADIAAVGLFNTRINIFTRNAQNTFSFVKFIPINNDLNYYIGAHDLNNDGLKDLVCGSEAYSYLAAYHNQKNWNFSVEVLSKSGLNGLVDAFSLDLNGDKLNDILVGTAELDPAKFIKYSNDGKHNFLKGQVTQFPNLSMNDFLIADIDKDGVGEILFAGYGSSAIGWFEYLTNDASPEIHTIYTGIESLNNLCVADLDNDGNEDIVASVAHADKLMWFKNGGNGKFSEKITILNGHGDIQSIQAVDIDNDGFKDLVVVVREGMFWLKNNGHGYFHAPTTVQRFVEVYNLTCQAMDLDQDGDQDLIFEHAEAGSGIRLEWLENTGKGNFLETKAMFDYDAKLPYSSIVFTAGDVDKDGDKDIVFSAAGRPAYRLFWIENLGNKTFSKPIYIASRLSHVQKIELTDLDGDSDLDVFLVGNDDFVSWLENHINNPTISGQAFWDKNANGKLDPDESIIKNLPIQLSPSATSTFTGSDGKYRFYVPDGRYQISVQPDECWQLTTDSLSYTINIAGNVSLNKNFGFQLVPKAQAVQPRLSSGPTRCGFDVPFVLSVHNEGCVPSKGMFGLVRSPLAKYLGASVFPDRVKGDTLLWNYSTLVGTASQQLRLNFQIAGTDFLGDTIHIKTLAYLENPQGQLQLASTFDYRSEIRCAYDPNDKQTFPNRRNQYPRNYTLFKEDMEFLIRFQNTGNDTAFTVVIRDTLDKNLDWSSFRPLVGSHPFETHIQANGAVSFTFKNILLPDSKTNEPLSHGFVSYRVLPKASLPEQTEIHNTAYIYFDFNPPIQTNTTNNVMVSSLPRITSTRPIATEFPHRLYPNPFQQQLWLELDATPNDYTLYLYNAQAQLVHSQLLTSTLNQLNPPPQSKGLYLYLLKDKHGQILASGKIIAH